MESPRFDKLAQELPRTQQVLLSDEFLHIPGPHALRQGSA
jgi:hypothetical protein